MRHKPTNVILRARNGDVIAYDETGLILRLSDQVIRDISRRVGGGGDTLDAGVLGDVDAWNLRCAGEWYVFDAKMPEFDHTRAYRRPVAGGDIIADAPGPVQAVLMLGGPRVSQGYNAPVAFPSHVVAPADELGSAGGMGTVDRPPPPGFQRLFEATQISALGDAILSQRLASGRALPLIVARTESDASSAIDTFSGGTAVSALAGVIASLTETAKGLGKRGRVLAFVLDFAEEDVISAPGHLILGLRGLISDLQDLCHQHGMPEPSILLRADGAFRLVEQWALAVFPPSRRVCVPGPRYAVETDRFGRLTHTGIKRQAALDAQAIAAIESGARWTCPVPLLAEFGSDPGTIDVTFQAAEPLVIDPADPFAAGPDAGFEVWDAKGPISVKTVSVSGKDERIIRLEFDTQRSVGAVTLSYASHRPGAIRDSWDAAFAPGEPPLHRWALPARLEVR